MQNHNKSAAAVIFRKICCQNGRKLRYKSFFVAIILKKVENEATLLESFVAVLFGIFKDFLESECYQSDLLCANISNESKYILKLEAN